MVIIREIELFDYIKIHNEDLCKKIYRLELSNIPYIIYKPDMNAIYQMVWYINHKYNIVGYRGTVVNKLLKNKVDEIIYTENITKMTATNYIDFEMSANEHDEFTLKYNDILRTVCCLTVDKTGIIVNKKGIVSLVAELYDISHDDFNYMSDNYEIYSNNSKYHKVLTGYVKQELGIDNIETSFNKHTVTNDFISFMDNVFYGLSFNKYESYDNYLESIKQIIKEKEVIKNNKTALDDFFNHCTSIDGIGAHNEDTISINSLDTDQVASMNWYNLMDILAYPP